MGWRAIYQQYKTKEHSTVATVHPGLAPRVASPFGLLKAYPRLACCTYIGVNLWNAPMPFIVHDYECFSQSKVDIHVRRCCIDICLPSQALEPHSPGRRRRTEGARVKRTGSEGRHAAMVDETPVDDKRRRTCRLSCCHCLSHTRGGIYHLPTVPIYLPR
jgi:hypothetical protein